MLLAVKALVYKLFAASRQSRLALSKKLYELNIHFIFVCYKLSSTLCYALSSVVGQLVCRGLRYYN